jgi:hypothetical protein
MRQESNACVFNKNARHNENNGVEMKGNAAILLNKGWLHFGIRRNGASVNEDASCVLGSFAYLH